MFIEHIKSELMTLPNFNQLSTTIGDNLYKGSNANNNNNSLINIPYHNDNLKSTILTPTSPNTNIDSNNGIDHNTDHLIKDSPFFVQPPFQPFSYSTSPNQTNLCQISPIKCYNDNNYDVCDTKHFNDNYCDLITSIADTPDSIFDANKYNYGPATPITSDKNSASTGNDDPNSQIFFKFDADVIERYNYQQQQHNHQTQSHQQEDKQQLQLQQQQSVVQQEQQQQIVQHQEQSHQQQQHHFSSVNYNSTSCNSNSSNLDQDYFNYNEINCQSKNQSPCSSPSINPWMSYMATIPATADGATTITTLERCSYDNGNPDNSPKHNNDGLMQYPEHQQKLPPIGTVFNYQNQYMNTMSGSNDGENTFNDCCFDTTFLEQFNSSSPTSNDTNLVSDAYLHPLENYNLHIDNKPNREYKDIWYQNATEEQDGDAELDENYENDDAMNAAEKDTGIKKELEMEPEIQEPVVLQCLWTDCNLIFPTQSTLVGHIEKNHIELRKGEEFACFWLGCIRRYRPFNARYKLLVHMRVHTLEKPNKCPFSGCNKAFSRLENLKIHQRSHTGERPYGCQYEGCLKAFSNSSDRAKHQRTHYDTKPYACQVSGCTKRYTDPSSLRKHVKNHNGRDGNATGRRKSYKDNSGNSSTTKMNKTSTRRRYSESSVYTKSCERDITPAPQTPIILENMSGENSFIYDDVFTAPSSASPALKPNAVDITSEITTNSSMNFDDMTNCIINMLEPPTSHTATSTALNSPSYNLDENNIDTNEFVSYEYVKRFLNDNIDYNIESNINLTAIEQSNQHSNYEVDFFNNML